VFQAAEAGENLGVPLGDPTEAALVAAAARFGIVKPELEQALPRVFEIPFSPGRKRMTTVHKVPEDSSLIPFDLGTACVDVCPPFIAFIKGSVDGLLDVSETVWVNGRVGPLDQAWRDRLSGYNNNLASSGMRVIGAAFRLLDALPGSGGEGLERRLTFVGMAGMIDPPRPEAAAAVAKCKAAGIRPFMITGDHPLTAQSIATQLGLNGKQPVLTGPELDRLSAAELEKIVESTPIYARVSPEWQ
jgi:Ca2+-transporting ATPase